MSAKSISTTSLLFSFTACIRGVLSKSPQSLMFKESLGLERRSGTRHTSEKQKSWQFFRVGIVLFVLLLVLGLCACLLAQSRYCDEVDATGRYAVNVGQNSHSPHHNTKFKCLPIGQYFLKIDIILSNIRHYLCNFVRHYLYNFQITGLIYSKLILTNFEKRFVAITNVTGTRPFGECRESCKKAGREHSSGRLEAQCTPTGRQPSLLPRQQG